MLLPLPIPASIYGLILLFLALNMKIVKLEQVQETANCGPTKILGCGSGKLGQCVRYHTGFHATDLLRIRPCDPIVHQKGGGAGKWVISSPPTLTLESA